MILLWLCSWCMWQARLKRHVTLLLLHPLPIALC